VRKAVTYTVHLFVIYLSIFTNIIIFCIIFKLISRTVFFFDKTIKKEI